MNRLSGHFWKVEKEFDGVNYIELKFEELEQIESYYIWNLGYPKFNRDSSKTIILCESYLISAEF
jgi:hypothetical protein